MFSINRENLVYSKVIEPSVVEFDGLQKKVLSEFTPVSGSSTNDAFNSFRFNKSTFREIS